VTAGKPGARIGDLVAALEGAFQGGGWHGPSVLAVSAGVSARDAGARPAGAHHSVHELIDHIQYWEEAGLRYATTKAKPKRTRRDWARPSLGFAASLRRMKATHRSLVAAVRKLREADLDRPIGTWGSGIVPLQVVLHGVAAHDAYHAGQIGLLVALLAKRQR
jgi:uncharacterized damage-inducible protein DinB